MGRHGEALSGLLPDSVHLGLPQLQFAFAVVGHLLIALQVIVRRVARPLVMRKPILTTVRLIRIGGVGAFFLGFDPIGWTRPGLVGSLLSSVQLLGFLGRLLRLTQRGQVAGLMRDIRVIKPWGGSEFHLGRQVAGRRLAGELPTRRNINMGLHALLGVGQLTCK